MSKINDGGPAFPDSVSADDGGGVNYSSCPGMSLRDFFAAAALQGQIAAFGNKKARALSVEQAKQNGITNPKFQVAKAAYEYADAMLAERRKDGGHE